MRSIVRSSVVLLSVALPGLAAAAEPAEGPAAAPVTLPEEPEAAPAPGTPASKEGTAPKPAPDSRPPAPPIAPPVGPSAPPPGFAPSGPPPPGMYAPGAPPPGATFAPPPPSFAPPEAQRPDSSDGDSGVHKPLGPLKSHVNIGVNVETVWYTGPSFDFFSERDNSTSPGVSLGYALWIAEPLSIVPELGWGTNKVSQDGMYGGAFTRAELKSNDVYGGLSVRYGLLSFLDTHVRVAGGASVVDAVVSQSGVSTGYEAGGVAPFGTLGGGLSLHSPAGALETRGGSLRSLLAGITLEGGYRLGGDLDITPTPATPTGRIPTTYMSFGNLERSGPYVRASLVVRF